MMTHFSEVFIHGGLIDENGELIDIANAVGLLHDGF